MDLSPAEIRVLGCLLEKQRLTPDAYPLTLNSLRLACNQATSRDPVVDYDDDTIRDALRRLGHRRFTRLASGARAPKYRHLLDEALPMSGAERAVMTVMMLRGPQTLNELRSRTERMHPFASAEEIVATLQALADRGLAEHVGRRPGQKEDRWRQLLGDEAEEEAAAMPPAPAPANEYVPPPTPVPHAANTGSVPDLAPAPVADDRVERLEREVATLRAELDDLKTQLGVT